VLTWFGDLRREQTPLSRNNVQIQLGGAAVLMQYDELLPFDPIRECPLPLDLAPIVHFTIGATRVLEGTVQSSPTVATVQECNRGGQLARSTEMLVDAKPEK
jgi:hypothetical protein